MAVARREPRRVRTSAKTSQKDWTDAGVRLLRQKGEAALTIDALAKALKRTKGSFYHHFESLDVYVAMLLRHFEQVVTQAPLDAANEERDSKKRALELRNYLEAIDADLDLAMRGWALREVKVKRVVARVDALRIEAFAAVAESAGRTKAKERAALEYAAFLGFQQLSRLSSVDVAPLEKLLHTLLG